MGKIKLILILVAIPAILSAQQFTTAWPEEPSAARDAFGSFRVSSKTKLFDAQFTYDRQPLLYDTITIGSGTAIAHDATNRNVDLSMTTSPTGSEVAMQTFEYFRYQPGNSQLIFITFNMEGGTANTVKYVGYGDSNNAYRFEMNGTTAQFNLLSDTGKGDEAVTQANWNIDKLDGTGTSEITLDFTKTLIVVIDFEALYVGRVRMGFNIGGITYYAHEFLHSNVATEPYIQTANLPIRVGITSSGTVTASMKFICTSVISEGGSDVTNSYPFSANNNVTAGNGSDTHLLSIQPKTTFNSITNRGKIVIESVDIMVTGNTDVQWKLVVGQALTSTSTADVNATYSAVETIAGTLSGSPSIVMIQGYVPAAAQISGGVTRPQNIRIPITLDHEGLQRNNGRVTLLVQGLGGSSATYGAINWREVR